jgi:hypothetical protein
MPDGARDQEPASAKPDKDHRRDSADVIRDQAEGYALKRKADAARAVSDIAGAMRLSGANFAGHAHVKAFFDNAAEGVDVSEGINRRTFSELYDKVEAVIRRRPTVAAGAAVLAGFALFRFFMASEMWPTPRSRAVVPVDVFPTPDI